MLEDLLFLQLPFRFLYMYIYTRKCVLYFLKKFLFLLSLFCVVIIYIYINSICWTCLPSFTVI